MDNVLCPGLYIHIPFCAKKCNYCDFFSVGASGAEGKEPSGLFASYTRALIAEADGISLCVKNGKKRCGAVTPSEYDSIYIGGGTPSLLPPRFIAALIEKIRSCFDIYDGAEVTIEANPGTLTDDKLRSYRSCGINRISLGVQSLDDEQLRFLGRIHTSKEAKAAVTLAKKYFDNVNVDFIFGIPGYSGSTVPETAEQAREKAEFIIDNNIPHVSFYSLITEPETPLMRWDKAGMLDRVGDDEEREMYYGFSDILLSHGYVQYEISNFALPGFESRHNLKYWSGAPYTGLGAGAVSFLPCEENGAYARFINIPDIQKYIRVFDPEVTKAGACGTDCEKSCEIQERLEVQERKKEYMMLGFRKTAGPDPVLYSRLFQGSVLEFDFRTELDELINAGYIREDLSLTRKGLDMGNEIFMKFV